MANNTTKSFSYKALRDIIGTAIGSLCAVIGFFAMNTSVSLFRIFGEDPENVREAITIVSWIYIGIAACFIVAAILDIISNSFQRLEIKTDEIVYSEGWLSKSTTSIPAHKIRSCTKTSGPLQRACGTMTIKITTAGDDAEIYFANIGDGETAYKTLCEIAMKNGQER